MMSPIFVYCGWYILFQRKTTHFLNMVCHLSQPDALSTCFMEGFYFCIATFASLIARILLCLHMQTHSVVEIELYADQINILHLRNQSILSWIPRNRIHNYGPSRIFNHVLNTISMSFYRGETEALLLVRCTSVLIAPRYGVSSPRNSSSFFWDQTESSFISSDLIIIGVINECE